MQIILENIHKAYGRRPVVRDVSLTIGQGEVVGLLGPNGAGKTTIFYIAVGIERPDLGVVRLDHRDITPWPLHRRARLGISYLAQEPSIFRDLSIQENLLLVLQETGVPEPERRWYVRKLLRELRLEAVAHTLGGQVSGGERRRAEIARALATRPHFLLLDEPFAGVDPIAVQELQTILRQLRQQQLGVLITDHNVRDTLAITDRAYILYDGVVLAAGTAGELAQNPQVREHFLGAHYPV
ncbi:MAG: LPS export ABC transporter ATP-binding protein [Gloeomargarita sp. SKYBB_i_bin120]|nr:LPS export ABC transporter ATP-binding protein [Gloeomargarita sp. SKYG98]MCS7291740.1 LPS export ABC transporter ATP-binding protein [Gloeomargarita sp. SKYB120]MDW8177300.1 LPS export ABC transporter ATP-binding protein [Gloeomargarita sp. SKYBB_i_bin120]